MAITQQLGPGIFGAPAVGTFLRSHALEHFFSFAFLVLSIVECSGIRGQLKSRNLVARRMVTAVGLTDLEMHR